MLDAIGDQALEAVSGVYRDMLVVPGFWACIRSIRKIWRLTSNWGFSFNSSVRSTMEHLMQSSAGFCADFPLFQSDHQRNDLDPAGPCPHQCYRRIVHSPGPGAHVCIVGTGFEDAAGGPHEVHIDFHQLGAAKIDGTHCFYHYILDHFSDVGPHLIADSLLKERVLPALIRIASVGAASGHGRDFWAVYASHIGNMNTDELKRKLEREIPEVVSLIRRQPMGLAAEAGLDSILSRFMQLMHLLTTAGTNPFPCR